ncbi:hypothetical protein HPP92_006575 [Vanilla planifolia]|uniref:DUF4220 domain-containing protein n=1 Tax=Vanilla planifolia TaxID=51239 RepID=A0A835VC18_VANPL|nr:hypothetical protein HPP92_006575 [Vanilla planifolia]
MAIWSNYLLANWLADFVLGQLSSITDNNSNNDILALWAPFLLLHLSGPNTITTYSIGDNELCLWTPSCPHPTSSILPFYVTFGRWISKFLWHITTFAILPPEAH